MCPFDDAIMRRKVVTENTLLPAYLNNPHEAELDQAFVEWPTVKQVGFSQQSECIHQKLNIAFAKMTPPSFYSLVMIAGSHYVAGIWIVVLMKTSKQSLHVPNVCFSVPISALTRVGTPPYISTASIKYPPMTFRSLFVVLASSHKIYRESPSIAPLIHTPYGFSLSCESTCHMKLGPKPRYSRRRSRCLLREATPFGSSSWSISRTVSCATTYPFSVHFKCLALYPSSAPEPRSFFTYEHCYVHVITVILPPK